MPHSYLGQIRLESCFPDPVPPNALGGGGVGWGGKRSPGEQSLERGPKVPYAPLRSPPPGLQGTVE